MISTNIVKSNETYSRFRPYLCIKYANQGLSIWLKPCVMFRVLSFEFRVKPDQLPSALADG